MTDDLVGKLVALHAETAAEVERLRELFRIDGEQHAKAIKEARQDQQTRLDVYKMRIVTDDLVGKLVALHADAAAEVEHLRELFRIDGEQHAKAIKEAQHDQQTRLDVYKMRIAALEAALAERDDVLMDVLASLTAAVSLLKRGSKKAAPSDRMFDQMIIDYERSIERARGCAGGGP